MRLSGKAAIKQFMGRGWSFIEDLILHQGFPARKILGIWESDSGLIDDWRRQRLNGRQKLAKRRGNLKIFQKSPRFINKNTN